jgi:hypothetical protein
LAILETTIFLLQMLAHWLTVAHFLHVWLLRRVQFTLIDGVLALHLHSAFSSAFARVLDGVFEDATDLELLKAMVSGDVCCVCLSSMTSDVKKVWCGNLYHAACLQEVVERARKRLMRIHFEWWWYCGIACGQHHWNKLALLALMGISLS